MANVCKFHQQQQRRGVFPASSYVWSYHMEILVEESVTSLYAYKGQQFKEEKCGTEEWKDRI